MLWFDYMQQLHTMFTEMYLIIVLYATSVYKGNNKITELKTILQRESPNS